MDNDISGKVLAFAPLAVMWLSAAYWMVVCEYVATEKHRRKNAWAILGFFGGLSIVGGPLAFLPLAVVPDLTEYESPEGSS